MASKRAPRCQLLAVLLVTSIACGRPENRDTRVQDREEGVDCRIGIVMPTTGEMAPYGAEGILAARLALEDLRASSNAITFHLFEEDSASQPEGANAAAAALIAPPKRVQVIIGEINSADTAAMVNPTRTTGVPIIAPTASMISLTQMSKAIFRIWPSDAYEAKTMAEHLSSRGITKVGVLFIQVQYGEEMAKFFAADFRKRGGEVRLESYSRETVDFKPLIRRLDGFRDLYIISYVEDASLLLKQARELAQGGAPVHSFFGTSVLDTEKLHEQAGLAANGLTFAVVGPSRSQDSRRRDGFAHRYRVARSSSGLSRALESAAQEPTFAGYHVYDAVSLAGSGCLAYPANEASQDEFVRYLRGVRDFAGLTGLIRFDANGDLDADRTVIFKRFGTQGIETLASQ